MKHWPATVLCFFVAIASCSASELCRQKLGNCTAAMQPVLNEARYMFPTTPSEIDGMCKVWSRIMDCVRKYVVDCSSEEQRARFNEAVSSSIDSVHAICSSERYRRDYLEYASCFRQVSTEGCGQHFRSMVENAYDPHSPDTHLCCAYGHYEKCVSEPIQRQCGPQALHILDDSLSSLKARCEALARTLKSSDKMCPADLVSNSLEQRQRPSLRHVDSAYSPLTTASSFVLNSRTVAPWSTPSWTQRTVIYPLLPTRQGRIYRRSDATISKSNVYGILSAAAIAMVLIY